VETKRTPSFMRNRQPGRSELAFQSRLNWAAHAGHMRGLLGVEARFEELLQRDPTILVLDFLHRHRPEGNLKVMQVGDQPPGE